jgi:hypothetical protein
LASGVSVAEVVDEAEDANDPGIALFVEVFGERLPSESELIAFLQQIKDSQLTLTPPDLFAPFSRRVRLVPFFSVVQCAHLQTVCID